MSKEIMIDGVDVSGHTTKEIEYNLTYKTKDKIIKNFLEIIRQLQRKAAECETLADSVDIAQAMCKELKDKLQIATEALRLILNGYGNDELDLKYEYDPFAIAEKALERIEGLKNE